MSRQNGAKLIALTLQSLGVKVIFGLVGIPVVQIAEESIALGIRFIAFRNEQAASYAATAYGYLTGRPGVCLVVGGPGVLHAIAGVGNSSANAWPLLLLAGSSETHLVTRGAFQELDAISLLSPHTKIAIRPTMDTLSRSIADAYRIAFYGRPGTGFVDLPADLIQAQSEDEQHIMANIPAAPQGGADPEKIKVVAGLLRSAAAPLLVIGKGTAYTQAEYVVRQLVDQTKIPFLPTPMGKGVLPDSHESNTASARSAALKGADVVLILGARLNWILHFGHEPKWSPAVTLIQVDLCAEEIGKNNGNADVGILGDINIVTSQLLVELQGWQFDTTSAYATAINVSKLKNEMIATKAAAEDTMPLTYQRAFGIIKQTLHTLSPPEDNAIVYVSEGANTMDVSRSVFPVQKARLRLDAGTHATMGVGLGYAIAAHCVYNIPGCGTHTNMNSADEEVEVPAKKKIVCLEGDSAFGFSMAELETMARYGMDVLIFVLNNGGVYHGDSSGRERWLQLQENSRLGKGDGLRSTSLGWEVGYQMMADMCGGKGYLVRNPEELQKATEEGWRANVPVVINIIIESGHAKKLVSRELSPGLLSFIGQNM